MKLKQIITIGYEGADLSDFLATLEVLGVTTLLDVRELPISRRKGFAKTALRDAVQSVGIGYRHEPQLGSPKAVRHRLREDGDYGRFFKDFGQHLKKQNVLLTALASELSGTVALLCYERDHELCHRKAVASALGDMTGLKPKHRGVQGYAQREKTAGRGAHTC
jgi:uncharacterized protein (DUF488 family)